MEEANETGWRIATPRNKKIGKRVYMNKAKAEQKAGHIEGAVVIPAKPSYIAEYARLAYQLLEVNPDYVKDPERFVCYIKGPNWAAPDPCYAHYEDTVRFYGFAVHAELSRIRELPRDEAVREMTALNKAVGITANA